LDLRFCHEILKVFFLKPKNLLFFEFFEIIFQPWCEATVTAIAFVVFSFSFPPVRWLNRSFTPLCFQHITLFVSLTVAPVKA